MARDCFLESIEINEPIGLEPADVLSSLSRFYVGIGDGDSVLKYSTQAIDSFQRMKTKHPMVYFDMARALILKKRF
ncbi:MAG: hypothetical protein GF411_08030 [Candidatus Lokiarchaeota archaeon]|nr:hypothetical protein [Candidatus Lokiarchaeota archaeon]